MRRPKARGDRRSLGGGGGHLELFRSSVTISRDGNVHVTGSTRFCTRRHGEAANQRARHASIAKLRFSARSTGFSGEATPQGSPPRRQIQHQDAARTRHPRVLPMPAQAAPEIRDEAVGEACVPRPRSARMRCAASRSAFRGPARTLGQPYHGSHACERFKRDTNWTKRAEIGAFVGKCAQKRMPPDSRRPARA